MNSIRQYALGCLALSAVLASLSGSAYAAGASDPKKAATRPPLLGEEAVKYEVAPVAKRKVVPVYPFEMLLEGHEGWAEASFVIDYAGRPLFANARAASDPAFAKALVAMIEASQYVPGRRDKHVVMSPMEERFQFAGEASLDGNARRVLDALRHGKVGIAAMMDLDERPHALRQDSPVYPRALRDDGMTGQAEIEFVVDREGRVLFPRIVSATHDDFGWAAATAVAQWRFQPPQKSGLKVDAIMRVPILFDAHKLASSD